MSIKSGRKLGFFAALAMLIGSVVGIGIFFKNGSVLGASDGNGATALTAWIVGGLLSLAAAVSFSELGTKMKTKNVHGLPAWAEKYGGKKFGYFVRFNYYAVFFALLTPMVAFFVSELFFVFLQSTDAISAVPAVWVNGLVALGLSVLVISMNFWSVKASGWIQTVTTILKFMPLVLAAVIGIAMFNTHNGGWTDDKGVAQYGSNSFKHGSFNFTGLLAALPAVLFAYDAFLSVAGLSDKTKGGNKTVSKVIFVGMISIIILYSTIAVAAMLHGGSIEHIIIDSLPHSAGKALSIFVMAFLFISGYGVLNGLGAAFVAYSEQTFKTSTVFGTKMIKTKFGEKNGLYIYAGIAFILGYLFSVVPGMILGTDKYIDTVSNFPTLFFFGIYATVIALFLIKEKDIRLLVKIAGWIFVGGVSFIVIYQLSYGFTIRFWTQAPDWTKSSNTGVGLFAPQVHKWTDLDFFFTFIAFGSMFMGIPFLNRFLKNKFEKEEVHINTQK